MSGTPTAKAILEGLRVQGMHADRLLAKEGLVLTQGGEPTFLPEDASAPEWNLEALGEEKLRLAWELARELGKTYLPGAVILRSNGKHYPGEPIPRWKLTLLRGPDRSGKKAGAKLWKNPSLLSHGEKANDKAHGKALSPRKFLSVLAAELGLSGALIPAYEDVEATMRAASLAGERPPIPRYSRLKKGFVQPRWTAVDRRKWGALHRAAGWVLPLDRVEGVWKSDRWVMPDGGDLLLLQGTSCIGLRLPLHRLEPGVIACALTAEISDGVLTLFLPPLPDADAFADLLSAIERTAEVLKSPPLSLEGYPPPQEEGWECISLIPDPGVIEVNLPPAADWESLEKTAKSLFDAAKKSDLRGTRRLPSGEIVPTGGGGHLVLGGPSLDSNPFLLKPALLPSFLRFIQRHPVLSYLFSGRFMGPSSQAPRIDESFFEIPYELEIALRAIESMEAPADPARIDAILRNLLLDLHGNTHKAEVSVDKFFNPFMPNGRLGLVEFRAIEMSPDVTSFLAIHALWRALAASFAARPYVEPLISWQGRLHDECLTPAFLQRNLEQVLGYLESFGFSFEIECFLPNFQFRFPLLAEESHGSVRWSLRRAAEPWPLLGEQPGISGGLVRIVDSSTERLELHIHDDNDREGGFSGEVWINGLPLPLSPHPKGGLVGSVRFRAISLPTCLHPQVDPHTPLEIHVRPFGNKGKESLWHYHPQPVKCRGSVRHLVPGDLSKLPSKRKMKTAKAGAGALDLRALG